MVKTRTWTIRTLAALAVLAAASCTSALGLEKGGYTSECEPGATRCVDDRVQACGADGQWGSAASCPFVCADGACAGACAPGSTTCDGATKLTCDSSGRWPSSGEKCPYACTDGACSGVCAPEEDTKCDGNAQVTCDANGEWPSAGTPCPFVCAGGSCTGDCTPGDTMCSGNSQVACSAGGAWSFPGVTCPFACTNGMCSGICKPGETKCEGNSQITCDVNGHWPTTGTACPYVCTNGSCGGGCMTGDTKCVGNTLLTCDTNGQWPSAGVTCPYACVNDSCSGICNPGTTTCSGNTMLTCDANGEWPVAGTLCPYVCKNGACGGVCAPGQTKACNACTHMTCLADGTWSPCSAPPPEVCNGIDDDCDGKIDEGLANCGLTYSCVNFSFDTSPSTSSITVPAPSGAYRIPVVELRHYDAFASSGGNADGSWNFNYANNTFTYDKAYGNAGEDLISGRVCLLGVGSTAQAAWSTGNVIGDGQTSTISVAVPSNPLEKSKTTLGFVRSYWSGGDDDFQYVSTLGTSTMTVSASGGNSGSWVEADVIGLSLPAGYAVSQKPFHVVNNSSQTLTFTTDPSLGASLLLVGVTTYYTCGNDHLSYDAACGSTSCTVSVWHGDACSYVSGTITQIQWVDNQ